MWWSLIFWKEINLNIKFQDCLRRYGEPNTSIRTIGELLFSWRSGHRPISSLERNNCFYWNTKAERSGSLGTNRVGIQQILKSGLERSFTQIYNFDSSVMSLSR